MFLAAGVAPACRGRADKQPSPDTSDIKPACSTASPSGLASCVDRDRYIADLERAAIERPPGSEGWSAVQDLCAQRMQKLGLSVQRQSYGSGVNVIGRRDAGATRKRIVISAHYDHVPGCEGADDNATGVAALLETARVLSQAPIAANLVFACWDEEERGMLGSASFAEQASELDERIDVALVYEGIGFASSQPGTQKLPTGFELLFPRQVERIEREGHRGDFLAVVGDHGAKQAVTLLEQHGHDSGLPVISLVLSRATAQLPGLADLLRSDHASFWNAGYPAIMLSDTADFRNPYYHCRGGRDAVGALDHEFATKTIRAVVATVASLAVE